MKILESRFALHRDLPLNLAHFCALLRSNGVSVGIDEEAAALESLRHVDVSNPETFRDALELALSKSPAEREVFEKLFSNFWLVFDRIGEITKTKETQNESTKKNTRYQKKTGILTISDWMGQNKPGPMEEEEAAAYSPFHSLNEIDFSEIPEHRLAEMSKILTRLSRKLATYKSRRYVNSRRGAGLDLRRCFRKNASHGEILDLYYREKKLSDTRFTLITDVSRSMEIYSVFLLNFIHAFSEVLKKTESFVFSTRILKLKKLGRFDFEEFRQSLSDYFPEWSGGTRIGECLREFEVKHARSSTDKKTVLVILSDGWDCGEAVDLSDTMRRLRSRVKKIIWLNPLMGFEGYKPDTAGMKACLPFIDELCPAHNVRSLEKAFLSLRP